MVRIKKNNFVYNKNIYQCIVPGCQNVDNDTNDPSIIFFIISEDGLQQKLLNKFLENVPIRPKISRICSAHFADNCFVLHNGVKLLKSSAVPTIRPAQNSTPGIDKINNKNRCVKSNELIQNIGNKKIDIKNANNVLMGPPQTTVVKKSQLKNLSLGSLSSTTVSQPIENKEVIQQHQKEYSGNFQIQPQSENLQSKQLHENPPHLQPLNGHLQVGQQKEQLRQLSYREELQQLRQQNKNLQYQPQEQHSEVFEKEPVLSQHQRQQEGNEESYDSKQPKSICHQQQQKNKSNDKIPEESKQSLQQNERQEELKWCEHQKRIKKHKQQLKWLEQQKRVQRHNRNLSQQKQRILPKHKQQEQLMEELKRRPEQQNQNSRHLQELLLAPPQQEQRYHLMLLQRDSLKNQQNLENCQRKNHQQQLQRGDVHNQKQEQHNKKEHQQLQFKKQEDKKQQYKQQQEDLQQQKLHSSNKLNLARLQLSHLLQQRYKHKQMKFEQQEQPKSQLQEKQNISTERHLINAQSKKPEQPKSQTSSPILHEVEHLIICGYIIFESCNNNFSYSCNFCSKNLENLNGLSAHLIRRHSNEIENVINSKRLNKDEKIIAKETNMEKQNCGIISISSKLYNLFLNCDCDFKFDCNFCDKKFEAINKFSEHIGKRHLDLLEKDKVNDMEIEDDIEIDPSCILSFDQIDEINEIDNFLNSVTSSSNNINNNKIVMSVPMSDNSEIFMTLDINENNTNNIKNNNNLNKINNKEIIEEQNIPMELDSLEKPKLKVNIKHNSWATRYYS